MSANPVSKAHQEYLASIRHRKILVRVTQIAILVLFIGLWELAAHLRWIDSFIMSSPSRVVNTLQSLWHQGDLPLHIGITLAETVAGFLLGTFLGILIAVILWWFPFVCRVMDPYLVVLNSLPKIALGPILIVWMGAGVKAIITMALLISLVVTIVTILTGFLEVSPDKVLLLRTLGANRLQILRKVILPANIPVMVSALKINVGMSWVGVIVGEFLVSQAGLGYLIVYGGQVFKLDLVMASTVILCIAAALMYQGVAILEKQLTKRMGK